MNNSLGTIDLIGLWVLLLLIPVVSFGHGKLVKSIPAVDATVNSVETIVLGFNQDVRLMKFSVTSESGEELDTAFKASRSASPEYSILVPSISKGEFAVNWSAMGEDSHSLTGNFIFKVE